jgi:hypothetical protein
VRALLDENVPHDLKATLVGHDIVTVQGLGWSGTLNGELLKRASGTIEALVTLDRKLEHQHDSSALPFGVVILRARSSKMQDLAPLVQGLLDALPSLQPGQVVQVGA